MASLKENSGTQISAAMLTDPKALKKRRANGTPVSFQPQYIFPHARRSSEPLHSQFLFEPSLLPDIATQRSKDDAYHILKNKGKKATISQDPTTVGQAASSTFDPRRLLNPKGFNKEHRQKDSTYPSTESTFGQSSPTTLQLDSKPSEINVNGLLKRDHDDCEGEGMGSLIEKVHNVSQREGRPQKKPKVENGDFDVDEDKKFGFVSGGKGGEIGDYLKDKKRQGIADSGLVNTVVDLTGGSYISIKLSFLEHCVNQCVRRWRRRCRGCQ